VDHGVEDAERILPEPIAAILVERIEGRLEVTDQLLAVRRTPPRIPDRVQVQGVVPKPPLPSEPIAQHHDLDVGLGTGHADDLDPELAELAQPTRLRPAVPEVTPDVVALERGGEAVDRSQVRAQDPGGAL